MKLAQKVTSLNGADTKIPVDFNTSKKASFRTKLRALFEVQ